MLFKYILYFLQIIIVSQATNTSCGALKRCTCRDYIMDCQQQELIEIPGEIPNDMRTLHLNDNKITEVGQIHLPDSELRTLILSNNKISKLYYNAFDNLNKLSTLSLSNNSISTIADDIFEWNPLKLEVMHLDGNKIEFIQHFLFYDLVELTELYLQNNDIIYIHPHAFLQLKNLRNLRLDGNRLYTFHYKWMDKFQSNVFEELRFDNNPWSCDCAMISLNDWMTEEKKAKWFIDFTVDHPITCQRPLEYAGTNVLNVSSTRMKKICDMPVITGISSSIIVDEGRDVLLRCIVDQYKLPVPTISWTAPNKDIYRLNTAGNFDGIKVHQDGSLLISSLNKTDEGEYTCTASNLKGTFIANTKITVKLRNPGQPPTKNLPSLVIAPTEKPKYSGTTEVSRRCPSACQCISRHIDCSADGSPMKITNISTDLPTDAITINLSGNNLVSLGPSTFYQFTDLEELRLDSNQISFINRDAFKGMGALTTLTLSENKLTSIEPLTFEPLVNLRVLVLDKNELMEITDGMFEGLSALQWLYIRHNLVKTLSDNAFASLNAIKFIHLESNQIGVIQPNTIKALIARNNPTIKKIFLDDNAFNCDGNMEEMRVFVQTTNVKLHFSDLFGEGITCSYPRELAHKFLVDLKAQLQPSARGNRTKHYSEVQPIDPFCGDFKRCICRNFVMDCRYQELNKFPANIPNTTQALYLNGNKITKIGQLTETTEVQTLILSNNRISRLYYDDFDKLSNLITLSLSNNSISIIADDVFEWKTLKLKVLYLDGNWMEFIQQFLFYNFVELTDLYLQNNKITFIHPHAFLQLKNLRNLRLDGNKLHTFDHKWIYRLQANNFKELRFDNNLWSCDCAMILPRRWLIIQKKAKWFTDLIDHPITCQRPPQYAGKKLVDMDLGDLNEMCEMPVITDISSSATIVQGRDVLLRCVVDDTKYPFPTISWTAPNKDVYRLNTAGNFDGITVHQDGSLLISGLNESDEGQYSCTASNLKGTFIAHTRIEINPRLSGPRPTEFPQPLVTKPTENPSSVETFEVSNNCPSRCQCISRHIDCSSDGNNINMIDIPYGLPTDAISINLAGNGLTRLLESSFEGFKGLEELRLDSNQISFIDPYAFKGMEAVTALTLSDNKLTSIHASTFRSLRHLQVLVLDKNKLEEISYDMFLGLDNLQRLYLRNNAIKKLNDNAFGRLNSIKFIHLESNRINVIQPNAIKDLLDPQCCRGPTIKKIFLDDNAFNCDNNMEEMRVFVKSKTVKQRFPELFDNGIKCSYPQNLTNRFLDDLNQNDLLFYNKGVSDVETPSKQPWSNHSGYLFSGIMLGVLVIVILSIALYIVWKRCGLQERFQRAATVRYESRNLNGTDDVEQEGLTSDKNAKGNVEASVNYTPESPQALSI